MGTKRSRVQEFNIDGVIFRVTNFSLMNGMTYYSVYSKTTPYRFISFVEDRVMSDDYVIEKIRSYQQDEGSKLVSIW